MQLSIPSELGQVRFLGVSVRALLAELACPAEQLAAVELCLVEAVNNVIEHAYREAPGHAVDVSVTADTEQISLTVSDAGSAMPEGALERAREARQLAAREEAEEAEAARRGEPSPSASISGSTSLAEIELAALAEGGYGLGLITELMDLVTYRREGGRNVLTMTMQLAGRGAPNGAASSRVPDGAPRDAGFGGLAAASK